MINFNSIVKVRVRMKFKEVFMARKTVKFLLKRVLLLILLMPCTMIANCQDTINKAIPKNAIVADGATAIYWGMASLNYERALLFNDRHRLSINAGFGGWYLVPVPREYSGLSVPLSFNFMEGSGNNHFEADLGIRYTFYNEQSDTDRSPLFPILNFGYRYQRPDGKGLIFKAFIGYTGIGIGVGKAF